MENEYVGGDRSHVQDPDAGQAAMFAHTDQAAVLVFS